MTPGPRKRKRRALERERALRSAQWLVGKLLKLSVAALRTPTRVSEFKARVMAVGRVHLARLKSAESGR